VLATFDVPITLEYKENRVPPAKKRKKIFVMDDESETRIFLNNLLDTGEFEPILVECGTAGIKRIIEENPALIILHILKYRDGNTLLYKALKQDKRLKEIPVIMLSSLNRETFFHYQKFKKAPVGRCLPEPEAYMNKPPEADELLQLVHTLTQTGNGIETKEMG
jgi:CheY-like chemotaxis protein